MDNWGSVYLEVTADGEFLHLPKKSATQADFEDGLLRLPVRILAERLHAGKNFGAVPIHTARETVRIPIEASAAGMRADATGQYICHSRKSLKLSDCPSGV